MRLLPQNSTAGSSEAAVTFPRPCFALVTNRHILPPPQIQSLLDLIARAAAAGVDLVHLRERDLSDAQLLELTRAACRAVSNTRTRVVVNERADIALAAAAHGVHLRADSAPASRLRVHGGFLIGRSVHSEEEARDAAQDGAVDYIVFGTVFPTSSKPPGHGAAGLDALRRVSAAVDLPVLAIGGIDTANAADVAASGAAGVAAIRLFADAPSLPDLMDHLRRSFDR